MNEFGKEALKVLSYILWFILLIFGIESLVEGYILVGVLLVSIPVGFIFFPFVNKKRQQKQREKAQETNYIQQKMSVIEAINALIKKGEDELSKGNFSSATQEFNKSFKVAKRNRKFVSTEVLSDIKSKIKLTQDKLYIQKENEIEPFINEGEEFEEKEKYDDAVKLYKKSLEITKEMPSSKARGHLLKKIKSKIDNIYIVKIDELIYRAEELKKSGRLYNAIEYFKDALINAENMYHSHKKKEIKEINYFIDQTYLDMIKLDVRKAHQLRKQSNHEDSIKNYSNANQTALNLTDETLKNKKVKEINYFIDQTYLDMLKPNIDRAHELRDELKYEDSIKNYSNAIQTALNLTDETLKNKKVREIKKYIQEVKVAIIKSTILDLGTKFGRLEVKEVAEECGEDEELIVRTVKEMIEGKEVYAKYFDSSRAVAFNLQANIDEIDSLMDKYKLWEKEEKDKI